MQYDEYLSQIARLKAAFGDKPFPEERIKIMWEKVKFEDREQLVRATNKIILDKLAPPSASEIINYVRDERVRGQSIKIETAYDCSWCGQSGFVVAKKKQGSGNFAFRCSCPWFSQKPKGNFIKWDPDMGFDYEPDFYCFQKPGEKPYQMPHKEYKPTAEQMKIYRDYNLSKVVECSDEAPF